MPNQKVSETKVIVKVTWIIKYFNKQNFQQVLFNLQLAAQNTMSYQEPDVPEEMNASTLNVSDDFDNTMNSECNITVIHVPLANGSNDNATKDDDSGGGGRQEGMSIVENEKKDYSADSKDSKDGSDSGVEGCAVETRVTLR